MSSGFLEVTFLDLPHVSEGGLDKFRKRVTPFANSEIYLAPIHGAHILTHGEDVKKVYKLSLNVKDIQYDFAPGDTIGVLPENNRTHVEKILTRLNVQSCADGPCKIAILPITTRKNPSVPKHLPLTSTLRSVFLNHVDLFTPPKKAFLKSLLTYVKNPEEREKLERMSSTKCVEYTELITGPGRDLLGLLHCFPSCQPPVGVLLEHLPPLLPRPYSISSSPLVKDRLDITFFIVQHTEERKGVCTGWLESLIKEEMDTLVPFYFRQANNFRWPDTETPLILVATGTGIAPFRSFLQHKALLQSAHDLWLFYGCRYATKDYLYKEEIEDLVNTGAVSRLNTAFSREGARKIYVQHCIERDGHQFVEWLLKRDAVVFVCGDRTVVRDVQKAVVANLTQHGGMGESDAEYFTQEMESRKKLVVDRWI